MTSKATHSKFLAALALAATLAGCGGGGGGGSAAAPPPAAPAQAIAITSANGKAVAADAAANVTDVSAVENGTSLITGVQVQAGQRAGGTLALAGVIRTVVAHAPAQAAAATGVSINETVQCTLGGSFTVSGNVAVQGQMTAGDNLALNATNCREDVDGTAATLNGRMTLSVVGGRVGSGAFDASIDVVFSAFSVQAAGMTAVAEGDMHMQWTYSGPSNQIFIVTGNTFTSTVTEGTATHASTWRNYRQGITLAGDIADSSLEANVEVRSPALGAAPVAYRVSGSMRTVPSTGRIVAGSLTVEGANSRLLLGVAAGAPDTFTLQIDPQGDGTYEPAILVTRAELEALR